MAPEDTHLEFASLALSSPLRGVIPVSSAGILTSTETPPQPHPISSSQESSSPLGSHSFHLLNPEHLPLPSSLATSFLLRQGSCKQKPGKELSSLACQLLLSAETQEAFVAKKCKIWLHARHGKRKNIYNSKNSGQISVSIK